MKTTTLNENRIKGTVEAWDTRKLGCDEEYAEVYDSAFQPIDMNSLAERLLDHAYAHQSISQQDDEQARWMADLIEATAIIKRIQEPKAKHPPLDIRFFIDESDGRV